MCPVWTETLLHNRLDVRVVVEVGFLTCFKVSWGENVGHFLTLGLTDLVHNLVGFEAHVFRILAPFDVVVILFETSAH